MHSGTRIGADATDEGNRIHQWVRKEMEPTPLFDHIKDKYAYQ